MKTCSSAICISYALISSFTHAQSFFDDFEDNNLTDGSPVTWFGSFVDSGSAIEPAVDSGGKSDYRFPASIEGSLAP